MAPKRILKVTFGRPECSQRNLSRSSHAVVMKTCLPDLSEALTMVVENKFYPLKTMHYKIVQKLCDFCLTVRGGGSYTPHH